jgi:succinoglycan biosynthesis protein ExoA
VTLAAADQATLPPLPEDAVVSIVVPARQAAATLPEAVAAALGQDPPPDEVVVAVGPSGDGTEAVAAALARAHPDRVRVVASDSGRTPDALNSAIGAARGQVVARVDAHAVLPPGYLAAAVEALRRTGAGNVGGMQVPTAEDGFARCVAAAMRSPLGSGGASYRSGVEAGAVDTVYLGVFRREALDAVGGYDPRFLRNQDAELNLRLRAAGYTVWLEPALQVTYRPRGSVRALASQFLQYGRWRRATARTHPGSLQPRQLAAPFLVAGLAGAVVVSAVTATAWPLVTAGGGYVALVAVGGASASPDLGAWPGTALALATMHLSWGVGFLLGPPRGALRT